MASSRSLLDFLDAPVVVGDPEGRAVYVNPAFEKRLGTSASEATGVPLANLFGGGGREAILRAVASVCGGEGSVRFRLREEGVGYAALASPIVAEHDRVGVLILLTQELAGEDRLLSFGREFQESLDELHRCINEMSGTPGVFGSCVEDAAQALAALRKRADELQTLLDVRRSHG